MKPLCAADPDIADLEQRVKELHTEIKWEYRFIKPAPLITAIFSLDRTSFLNRIRSPPGGNSQLNIQRPQTTLLASLLFFPHGSLNTQANHKVSSMKDPKRPFVAISAAG
jgi:hypothetical protein